MYLIFFPFGWPVGVFQAEIQLQPKEGCIFGFVLICKARLSTQCQTGKKAFLPSQIAGVMGIFPLSPYSRKSVSRKVFSYLSNHSNRMLGFFFLCERRYFREAAALSSLSIHSTQSIHSTFEILLPAPNFACKEAWSDSGVWGWGWTRSGPAPGSSGFCAPLGAAAPLQRGLCW